MSFKPGCSGNPLGRKKGIPNRATARTRQLLEEIVTTELPRLRRELKQMQPEARAAVLVKLLNYILPRLSTVQVENMDSQNMDEKSLDSRIKEMLKIGGYSAE